MGIYARMGTYFQILGIYARENYACRQCERLAE